MNRQPFGTPPRWWGPKLAPRVVRWSRSLRDRTLRQSQRLVSIDSLGIEHLTRSVADGCGVLITPNHSAHYDWAALYAVADEIHQPLYFMIAWQVFVMSNRFHRWLMQRLGCFSIDRKSTDRRAFREAIQILRHEPHPLVIFPEGDVYHVNDRITPFRDGAAAIAISAAKRTSRPIVAVPCGIKFWYIDDPTRKLLRLMSRLERRLGVPPKTGSRLVDRIYGLAETVTCTQGT